MGIKQMVVWRFFLQVGGVTRLSFCPLVVADAKTPQYFILESSLIFMSCFS